MRHPWLVLSLLVASVALTSLALARDVEVGLGSALLVARDPGLDAASSVDAQAMGSLEAAVEVASGLGVVDRLFAEMILLGSGSSAEDFGSIDGTFGLYQLHVGARVMSHADPDEILVSSTVRDLVAGSGIGFEDAGRRELKGIQGDRQLYRVTSA